MDFSVRPIVEEDLERIMNWRMSPDVTKYMNTDPQLTLEDQKKWFFSIMQDDTVKYWMVEVDGQPAGVINLADIDRKNKRTSWGYYIGEKDLRSIKLALSLELSLYAYVFEDMGLDEIYGPVFSLNWEVVKIHQMCGAEIVREVKGEVEKNGIKYDVIHMSISKSVWEQKQSQYKFNKIDFSAGRED